ncbi:hypothetical protein BGY98DRAFT_1050696 [Russula aff. rugulosa BPL654]|nr:hypothetical protein BGY98DRAFT_1050696 [Russula aff. rugulosa BPL654]
MDSASLTLDIQQRQSKSVTHTLNSGSTQHHRTHERDAARIPAVPAYHPDYDESAQHESGGGEVDYDSDDGKRFAEYEKGYEVRPIDHEQLLAECIADRAHPPSASFYLIAVSEVERVEQDDYDGDHEKPPRIGLNLTTRSCSCLPSQFKCLNFS